MSLCQQRSIKSKLWLFQYSCMNVRIGTLRRPSAKELMLWTVVLEKTLKNPLDWKEIKPLSPKGNNFWIFTEGLMLKLRLQCFDHLLQRADSLEKTLTPGKIEGRRRMGQQGMRWLDGILTQWTWVWASSRRWWRTGKPGVLQFMGLQRVRHKLVIEQKQVLS